MITPSKGYYQLLQDMNIVKLSALFSVAACHIPVAAFRQTESVRQITGERFTFCFRMKMNKGQSEQIRRPCRSCIPFVLQCPSRTHCRLRYGKGKHWQRVQIFATSVLGLKPQLFAPIFSGRVPRLKNAVVSHHAREINRYHFLLCRPYKDDRNRPPRYGSTSRWYLLQSRYRN
jgi:hypothetical protein